MSLDQLYLARPTPTLARCALSVLYGQNDNNNDDDDVDESDDDVDENDDDDDFRDDDDDLDDDDVETPFPSPHTPIPGLLLCGSGDIIIIIHPSPEPVWCQKSAIFT